MQPQHAIDLCRETLLLALSSAGPVLLAGLVAGILAGLAQSMFQVHDQIAGFVPRIAIMAMVLAMTLPWMSQRLTDFSRQYFSQPVLLTQSPSPAPSAAEPETWRGN
jgi:flagellar biosynthesis protein FliQ